MAGHQPQGPYRIMAFQKWVPGRWRFVILLFTVIVFQFSGGIYLASVSQLVGGKTLLREDIMMAGYAGFIGMVMAFPLLFRFKFRFTSRNIILIAAAGLVIANIITMYTQNLLVLITTCLVAGFIRMVGTFECFSTLQLKITPTRDMAVFFSAIYTVIVGSIQLSGITATYIDYFLSWQYMHVLIVGLLIVVMILALVMMKDFRLMKRLPLYGIDWIGLALWTSFLLSGVFVLEYGEHEDWFDSKNIRIGTILAILFFGLGLYRMLTAKRPYLSTQVFSYKNYKSGLAMMGAMTFLLATPNVLQNAFTNGVLRYDSLNAYSLNWFILGGVILGTIFTWYTLAELRLRYKPVIFTGFICLVAYQVMMYFLIDPSLNIEKLYIPSILRGAGNSILYVVLTRYCIEHIPFTIFFQGISMDGFIRSTLGSALAAALLTRGLNLLVKKNSMLLSAELDSINSLATSLPTGVLYGEVTRQALLISIKELFGWAIIFGIVILLLLFLIRYIRPVMRLHPKIKYFRRYIRRAYRLKEMPATK